MKSRNELFNKLSKLKISELDRLGLEKDEIEYIKTKLLNDNIGLKLNYKEYDEKLTHNYMLLKEIPELGINVKENEKNNLLIEGENYYALKALQASRVRVDVIYIDPPYNTGKEFIYNDDFSNDSKIVGSDDPHKHSKWLSFMKKRLILARELLSEEGVMFVSIDDNEQAYLKVLMDEIFGENNFVNQLVWVANKKGRQITNKAFARTYEYVLMYSKKIQNFKNYKIDRNYAEKNMPWVYTKKKYKIGKDYKGEYFYQNELHNTNIKEFNINTRKNLFYPIYTNGKKISISPIKDYVKLLPPKNNNGLQGVWRWSADKVNNESIDLIIVKEKKSFKIFTKIREFNYTPKDIIMFSNITTKSGGNDINLLKIDGFNYPKPVSLLKFLLQFSKKDATILDFFAGSGTTGQAVMELNEMDDGNRRYMLLTNNENAGIDIKTNPELGISRSITRERVYRVIKGIGSNDKTIKWEYSEKQKSLKNNSLAYLKVEMLHKVNGEFEDLDKCKSLFEREFNKDIDIIDLRVQDKNE